MKKTQIHCLGNGRVCVYGSGADIIQAFGPDYSAPDAFSSRADKPFLTEKISHRQYVHSYGECVITDYLPDDKPVFYRAVKGAVELDFEVKNAVIQPTPYENTYITITYEGSPVYIYGFHNDGRPKAYTSQKKRYTAIKYFGKCEFEKTSDSAFTLLCKDCTVVFAFSDDYEEVFKLINEPSPEYAVPVRDIKTDKYYNEVCDGYDAVVSQQSYNGSVLAGYNYHLCYIRDNYGVLRFLLSCGAYRQAELLLKYYISVYERCGKIHNAQGMTDFSFHIHENDKVEITGYIVLMFSAYYEKTGDTELLNKASPLIEYCLRCQSEAMVGDVLPFNGDETYVAGGFMPRSALNDGSAEATALYHQSIFKTFSIIKYLNIAPSLTERIKSDAAAIEKNYLNNFMKDGVFYANKPGIGYAPEYRHGVRACGHGFGLCFRNENGDYVCPDCVSKKSPRFYGDAYGKRFFTEAAVLCPAFTGTALIPDHLIKETAKKIIADLPNRTRSVGYEYGLLLYAAGYSKDIAENMLCLRDKFGAWSEYYEYGVQSGTLYRTWETSLNLAALIETDKDIVTK